MNGTLKSYHFFVKRYIAICIIFIITILRSAFKQIGTGIVLHSVQKNCMKKRMITTRVAMTLILVIFISQVSVFARSNDNLQSSSGLTPLEAITAFALLLLAIILPLFKSQVLTRKYHYVKHYRKMKKY